MCASKKDAVEMLGYIVETHGFSGSGIKLNYISALCVVQIR